MHFLSSPKVIISSLVLIVIMSFFLQNSFESKNNFDNRSKAAGNTGQYKVITEDSIASIQSAIDSAKSGDTIQIPAGTYSGATSLPIGLSGGIAVSSDRGAANTCFLRIEGKNITLKGAGAVLFGEGHDQPYKDPYQTRAGLCVINGGVTLERVNIKEFQKRCAVVYNSTIIVKNSTIEGCDEGGVSLLGNSAGLFVNDNFYVMNFGGVMLWQNSTAKVVNSTFYGTPVIFFGHPGTNDGMRGEFINNIFYNSGVIQVDWWKSEVGVLKRNTYSYNLHFKENNGTCGEMEYCDNYTGKKEGDPLFTAPVFDPRGMAAWSDMSLKEGSPAIGNGDPNIPGVGNMGVSGGPCTDPNSSICNGFVQSNLPVIPVPPTNPPPPTGTGGGGNGGGGGGGHIPPTVTGMYPEPSFAWPTTVDDNGQSPTTPPDGGSGNNNPTALPNTGGGEPNNPNGGNGNTGGGGNPTITYYFPPTGTVNNGNGNNPSDSNNGNGRISTGPGDQTNNPVSPAPKPTPKPLIDIDKTIKNAKTAFSTFFDTLTRLSKLIMP